MTLRDALAAAIGEWVFVDHSGPRDDRALADAILSDPAFREALVEAVAGGLGAPIYVAGYAGPVAVGSVAAWIPNITGMENVARAIVARMLGDGADG